MTTICMLLDNPFLTDARVARHANSLSNDHHRVILICPKKKTNAPLKEVSGNLTVRRYGTAAKPRRAVSWLWELLIFGGGGARKAMELASEYRFDIVYANDLPTLETAYRLSRKAGVPLIFDAHEIYLEQYRRVYKASAVNLNWKGRLARRIIRKFVYMRRALAERLLVPRVDLFVTVNPFIERYYKQKYRLRNTRTVLNVPEASLALNEGIGLRRRLGIGSNEKLVGYHGVLAGARGVMELAGAARLLPDDIHVVLIGYGDAWDELQRLIDSYERRNLHLVQTIPHENLIASLSDLDLSVVPIHSKSLSYFLSSPNKLFESLLAGVPLLVPNYPFLKKVVQETGMGLVFDDPITADSLAKNIRLFIEEHLHRMPPGFVSPYRWELEEKEFLSAVQGVNERNK